MKKLITTCLSTLLCTSALSFAETYVVEAYSMTFVPEVVNVEPGDVIRWQYVTGYPHDVTTGMGCEDDGYLFLDIPSSLKAYVEWTVPDDAPSEIPYFCSLHCGGGMTGMIYVDTPRMGIGIVDASNCDFSFEEDGTTATMVFLNYDSANIRDAHFGLGVEIEDGDVDVSVSAAGGPVYLLDASAGTTSIVKNGLITLSEGHRYMFSSSTENDGFFYFSISWPDEGEDGMDMGFVGVGLNSVSAMGDDVMFRASELGEVNLTFTVDEETSMQMSAAGNVTCSTLTIPTDGSEGDVEMPVGTHVIELNGDGSGMGVLVLEMGGDDDGGGGDSLPEDVNGDGVVDVSDLLALISAWGATSP
jgi:plastocyanin